MMTCMFFLDLTNLSRTRVNKETHIILSILINRLEYKDWIRVCDCFGELR